MSLQFHQFAYNSDNYGVLVHDTDSGATACIDAGDGQEVLNNKPETLFQALSQALDSRGSNPPLVISADANANYQSVVTAMDIAGRLGITNFSMATAQAARK